MFNDKYQSKIITTLRHCTTLTVMIFSLSSQANLLIDQLQTAIKENRTYSLRELSKLANRSDLIMIGETHSHGSEKDVLHVVTEKVLGDLELNPDCAIEASDSISDSILNLLETQPKIKSVFESNCKRIESIENNDLTQTGFTNFLSTLESSSNRVVTYTGLRHVLPWGKYYPSDFSIVPLDTKPNQTILTQIPKNFKTNNKKLLSINFISLELLYINALKDFIRNNSSNNPKNMQLVVDKFLLKLNSLKNQAYFEFDKNESFKIINLDSLNAKNEKHILVLYKNKFSIESKLIKLISSFEFIKFITSLDNIVLTDDYMKSLKRKSNPQLVRVLLVNGQSVLSDPSNSDNYIVLQTGSILIHGFIPNQNVRYVYIDQDYNIGVINLD